LFLPNVSLSPVAGTVTAVVVAEVGGTETAVDVVGAVVLWLLEQAGTKIKLAISATVAAAIG
jgi:hypothetical protein